MCSGRVVGRRARVEQREAGVRVELRLDRVGGRHLGIRAEPDRRMPLGVHRHGSERQGWRTCRQVLRQAGRELEGAQQRHHVLDAVVAERVPERGHAGPRAALANDVAQEAVAHTGEELRAPDVDVRAFAPVVAMAASTFLRVDLLAAYGVAGQRPLLEVDRRRVTPRPDQRHQGVHVGARQRAAALDSPRRHRRARPTLRDRPMQVRVVHGGEEIGMGDAGCLVGPVPLAGRAVTDRAHLPVQLAAVLHLRAPRFGGRRRVERDAGEQERHPHAAAPPDPRVPARRPARPRQGTRTPGQTPHFHATPRRHCRRRGASLDRTTV